MYQEIDGVWVEVVDLKTMPKLPITGLTEHEMEHSQYVRFVMTAAWGESYARWNHSSGSLANLSPVSGRVARALTAAIEAGLITEPGKYGIKVDDFDYKVFKIID